MIGPRLIRLLLLAYPPGLRRDHGDEIALAVSESWKSQRSLLGRIRFAWHLAVDFIRSWPRAWRSNQRQPGRRPNTGRRWRGTFGSDLRNARRMFTHSPWFTAGAVLTLALGIGATTAIVTLADGTLLRPLPIPEPERVLQLDWSWSHPDFRDLEVRQGSFSDIAAWTLPDISLEHDGQALALDAAAVSGGYMRLAGIRAVAGRVLGDSDDRPGAPLAIMLSERLWQRVFDRQPEIVGSTLAVNGRPVTVVGIVPRQFRGFSLSEAPEIFLSLGALPEVATGFLALPNIMNNRGAVWLQVIGRLRPGMTHEQAERDVEGIYRQLYPPKETSSPPERLRLTPVTVRAIGADAVDDVQRFVSVLAGAAVVTLLLACATVANLLLVRAERRQRELAVRAALGAGRLRLLRMLMTESVAIGIVAGLLSVLIARVCLSLFSMFSLPGRIPVADLDLSVRPEILLAALALGIATSLIFGLAPLWRLSRLDVTTSLRQGDRGSARQPLRSTLIAVQVALCVLLLGGGLAFGRAVRQAFAIDLGFDTRQTAVARVDPTLARYDTQQMTDYGARVLERFRSTPWVNAVGWSAMQPLGGRMRWNLTIGNQKVDLDTNAVSDGYFEAMGISLVAGRTFTPADSAKAQRVVIVSAGLAKKFWPDGQAVGAKVVTDSDKPAETTAVVVGIAGDVRRGLERAPAPTLYFPISQHPDMLTFGGHVLVVRSAAIPASEAARESAALLRQVDARVPVIVVRSLHDQVGLAAMAHRLGFMLFALFASLAIVLTTLGVYAVVAFAVARRAREIGIRVALGAQASQIVRLVMRQGAAPLIAGLVIGVIAFRLSARALARFALSLPVFDATALAFLAGAIAVVALVAMLTPARRALAIDPAVTLRTD